MRALIVDLLCNSPFYDAALVNSLRQAEVDVELASPRFYLEPDYLDPYPAWDESHRVRYQFLQASPGD